MSFEGYYQLLCGNGHYYEKDVYELDDDKLECFCGAKIAWRNMVNTTNGFQNDHVVLELIDRHQCKCTKCGNIHLSEPDRYIIPKNNKKRSKTNASRNKVKKS